MTIEDQEFYALATLPGEGDEILLRDDVLDLPPVLMDDEEIERYLRSKTLLEAEMSALKRQMELKVKQKATQLNDLNHRYGQRLEQTIRARMEQSGQKTFHFDYATCRMRKAGGNVAIVDEKEASNMAIQDCPLALNLVLDKKAYLEYAKDYASSHYGELPPGCDIEPERLSFSVSTNKGEA